MLRHMLWESMELGRSNDEMTADAITMMDKLVGINPEAVNSSETSSHKLMEKVATAAVMDVMAMAKVKVKAVRATGAVTAIIIRMLMLTAAIPVGIIRV